MRLSDLSGYKKIIIQCHDNPDPDALASGWALYTFFKSKGISVRFVYSGRFHIAKSNLMLMLSCFGLPIEYEESFSVSEDELLITVDCQYGQGNVTCPEASNVAIIDHHNGRPESPLSEVRSSLGSCSTLVWKLMKDEGYDFQTNKPLSTALYYGLLTDTGNFTEMHHPLDKDMQESLIIDRSLVNLFCNSNISLEEMVIAGDALTNYRLINEYSCGIIQAKPCDPNILGFVGDLALQVDKFTLCIAFCEVSGGYKLSFRSCDKTVRANEFAEEITREVGSGGGHTDKAGGFISRQKLEAIKPDGNLIDLLYERVDAYFKKCEVIETSDYELDTRDMKEYVKLPITVGYADPKDFLEEKEHILIRTLEGDVRLTIEDDFYIMVGLMGEVYPIKKEKFEALYEVIDKPYDLKTEYLPTVHSETTGDVYDLLKYTKSCLSQGGNRILAREINGIKKIFNDWYTETYMLGREGDFLACKTDDHHDIYIIARDIFLKSYKEC